MKSSNNETMKLTKSRIRELEAVSLRTCAVETWVDLGKGGQKVEKWCGFSHLKTAATRLFPHNSTQVVDFPRMYDVRLFWGRREILATDETQIKHGWGKEVEQDGTERRVNHGWTTMDTDLTEK